MDAQLKPKRSRLERIVYTALAVALVALVLDGIFGPHGAFAAYRLKLQVNQKEQKVKELDQENQVYAQQVRKLKTDPKTIEHVAHERMGLVKPGELIFQLPPQSPKSQSSAPNSSGVRQQGPR